MDGTSPIGAFQPNGAIFSKQQQRRFGGENAITHNCTSDSPAQAPRNYYRDQRHSAIKRQVRGSPQQRKKKKMDLNDTGCN